MSTSKQKEHLSALAVSYMELTAERYSLLVRLKRAEAKIRQLDGSQKRLKARVIHLEDIVEQLGGDPGT